MTVQEPLRVQISFDAKELSAVFVQDVAGYEWIASTLLALLQEYGLRVSSRIEVRRV